MNCLPLDEDPRGLVRRYLADERTGWSVGTWGAIGEFQYDLGEPDLAVDLEAPSVRSARGALTIARAGQEAANHIQILVDDNPGRSAAGAAEFAA